MRHEREKFNSFFPISENSLKATNSGRTWAVCPCLHERSKHYVSDLKTVSSKLACCLLNNQAIFVFHS